jgi:hypothetical protein
MGLRSLIPSVVRTLVPVVVALLVRLGLRDGAEMDDAWLVNTLTVVVTMAYYVVVRFLEQHWDKIGWLLGYAKQPVYVKGEVLNVQEVPTPPTTVTQVETDENPQDS